MKLPLIKLIPLTNDNKEQFIIDNQLAFKYGALTEFGERDNHIDKDGEIISRKTIKQCIENKNNETYQIIADGKYVGGAILHIDNSTNINELEILFIIPNEHTKGYGYAAWLEIEKLHPETKVWKTCTPYFEKRNIHFYINKCGFKIDEFWCEYFQPSKSNPDENHDEGPSEMFHFIKVIQK